MVMDRIPSPFSFVPLSDKVVFPPWANRAGEPDLHAQDWPFEDGISGTLDVEIEALTELFVRGRDKDTEAFSVGEGDAKRYAIPGSTLRGLIRNVVEIAGFGKMSRVNDHRYGVRDLTAGGEFYRRQMAGFRNVGRESIALPYVSAGWLRGATRDALDPGSDDTVVAEILPCNFGKIHYDFLLNAAARAGVNLNFGDPESASAPQKYRAWTLGLDLTVPVHVHQRTGRVDAQHIRIGDYGEVRKGAIPTDVTLVFTGQPARWPRPARDGRPEVREGKGSPKHHDFVFWGEVGSPLQVTRRQLRDFDFIHANRARQHGRTTEPNAEWEHWRQDFLRNGGRVPVFFVLEDGSTPEAPRLRAFGLAMMFRLAYRYSIGDVLEAQQPEVHDRQLDLAEAIFGRVEDRAGRTSEGAEPPGHKGRVSFSHAVAKTKVEARPEVRAVLGAPKASFYPSYIEQRGSEPGSRPGYSGNFPQYVTLMDEDARLRGWKRYRPFLRSNPRPPLPEGVAPDSEQFRNLGTTFRPLPSGTRFHGVLRFHNLRPAELGAVLWALDFGRSPDARHVIGTAKSHGFGTAQIHVRNEHIDGYDGEPVSLDACRGAFAEFMEGKCGELGIPGGWRGSLELFQLLAAARPLDDSTTEPGRYPRLAPRSRLNEFADVKNAGLALPPPAPFAEYERAVGPVVAHSARERAQAAREQVRRALSALRARREGADPRPPVEPEPQRPRAGNAAPATPPAPPRQPASVATAPQTETWSNAQLGWTPGNRRLTAAATHMAASASVEGDEAARLVATLPADVQASLKKKGFMRGRTATVRIEGRMRVVVGVG